MNVMTPEHPRWDTFCERLADALGGTPGDCNGCGQPDAHENAHAILEEMGVDIDASLEFFHESGGHCDCEILLNVAAVADEA